MSDKPRWVTVGAAWKARNGEGFDLSISLGIFGEIRLMMKPAGEKRHPASPDYNLIVRAENLLLNRFFSSSSGNSGGGPPPPGDGDIPF